MRKLIIYILTSIAITFVSCSDNSKNNKGKSNEREEENISNQNDFVPNISFEKDNKLANICNVNIQLSEGENKKIEYFEYSDLTNREDLLCKNISELDEFSFIDSLPTPKEFGTLVKQYSVLDSYTEITNPVSYESSFIKYFLFKDNKSFSVVREHWTYDGFKGVCDSKAKKIYNIEQQTILSNEVKNSTNLHENNVSKEIKTLNETILTLLDQRSEKARIFLGKPDKFGHLIESENPKCFDIYFDRVNDKGQIKHLVLFYKGNMIREIYAVGDGEKAYYGIHYIVVSKNGLKSNGIGFKVGKY